MKKLAIDLRYPAYTGLPIEHIEEGGDIAAFLDREVERYRGQLERYARVVRALDPRPIRLALYYPRVDEGWRAWDAPC